MNISNRTCEAAHAEKALNKTSTIRWLVNTFPPTTAAVSEGLRIVPSGILRDIGLRQPCNKI